MLKRRALTAGGASALLLSCIKVRNTQAQVTGKSEAIDYADFDGGFPPAALLFGTNPATGEEEDKARQLLEGSPNGETLLETARYFELLKDVNKSNHYYNAQWPDRWNPVIVGFYQPTSLPKEYVYKKGDTIDWCAAFVNWCLVRGGRKHSGDALSGSFRPSWKTCPGKETKNPVPGDIVVFERTDPALGKVGRGHVGIYVEQDEERIRILGGNQKNGKKYSSVNTAWFAKRNSLLTFNAFVSFESIPKA